MNFTNSNKPNAPQKMTVCSARLSVRFVHTL